MIQTILNSLAIVGLALGLLLSALTNDIQTEQIKMMKQEIRCLEWGGMYVGNGLCSHKK